MESLKAIAVAKRIVINLKFQEINLIESQMRSSQQLLMLTVMMHIKIQSFLLYLKSNDYGLQNLLARKQLSGKAKQNQIHIIGFVNYFYHTKLRNI